MLHRNSPPREHRTAKELSRDLARAMVLPSKSSSSSSGASVAPSLLKKARLTTQRQSQLNFSAGSSSSSGDGASSSKPAAPQRQASIFELKGVVALGEEAAAAGGEEIPTTLYLGNEAILQLKQRLQEATAAADPDAALSVLRRLSMAPCTRSLLETTGIGATVGHLRKHDRPDVSDLAARIVRVWKDQIAKEPRRQR